ncbi:phasin family protein [Pseudooceanicola sediminis]|uniref:Phasin family protein n=1 Tax=Pseudooceanicola sediminis TaxID=2211117 RepID=A0A399IZD1_9RHOB|nr:phasin family protein [Pseudooceanicola sediminis]KAA2313299.1 phasin family protein [Puniceibacterium sp. HSS470]RII38415.1 phasin family protein [Pseudooceanicola sediminis]|tara:strand:+ start:2473 stop:2838 length:366 start_codon:yes stop_codon:yes gene_type:complete
MERKVDTAQRAPGALGEFAASALTNGLGGMVQMATAWLEGASAISAEVSDFVGHRVRRDVAAQQALLSCRSLAEAEQVRAEFVRTAMRDYMDQTGKVVEMMGQVATDMATDQRQNRRATPL